MKKYVYVVINNNHQLDVHSEWVEGVYSTPQQALAKKKKCESELLQWLLQHCKDKGFDNPQEMAQVAFEIYENDTPLYIKTFILDDKN